MSDLRGRAGHRSPGWYRDPSDPTRFRHWSGRSWSTRHRSWPAWDLSGSDLVADRTLPGGPDSGIEGGATYDGPVTSILPAESGASRSDRARRHRSTAASRTTRGPGGHTGRWEDGRRSPLPPPRATPGWHQSRRPLAVFAGLVGVAVLLMAVSVGISRPQRAAPSPVAADAAYVTRASALCDAGLSALRSDSTAAMTAAPADSAQLAASAERDATGAAAVASSLGGVSALPDAKAAVAGWLGVWHSYVADQRQLAGALRDPARTSPGAIAGPDSDQLAQRVTSDVVRADDFAESNGLGACRLGSTPTSAGPVVPIP